MFDLSQFLESGTRGVVRQLGRSSGLGVRQWGTLLQWGWATSRAAARRRALARQGELAPAFLIASITESCNLACDGCYSRAQGTRPEGPRSSPLTASRWGELFAEARRLGVSFILLAGGEPLTRPDVLAKAARFPDLLFPVFTNGTLLRGDLVTFFARHRHLIPLISLEGRQDRTDHRRAAGVYERVVQTMDLLAARSLLFGTSITVTVENLDEVTSASFFQELHHRGCRAAVFVEFVPVSAQTWPLVLREPQRLVLRQRLDDLQRQFPRALFVTFPGDEAASGGCLAAGRGFFHIGPDGAAEPCPFSPHSDLSLRDHSLREALKSPLFRKVAEAGLLQVGHAGGCALVEQDAKVVGWSASRTGRGC